MLLHTSNAILGSWVEGKQNKVTGKEGEAVKRVLLITRLCSSADRATMGRENEFISGLSIGSSQYVLWPF